MTDGILYWITGLSGSGKTTIGNRLYYEIKKTRNNVVILDGDILRKTIGDELGFSYDDRFKRAKKYANICKMLTDQGITVICCTIAMFDEIRKWNVEHNKAYIEVFLDVEMDVLKRRDQNGLYSGNENGNVKNVTGIDVKVEFPKNPSLVIRNNGQLSVKECVDQILAIKVETSTEYNRDTEYWNEFYLSSQSIEEPSLFARSIENYLISDKTILDLGCGNGRDSSFFRKIGLNVTGIDASDVGIKILQEKYKDDGNACFICDDFVCSPLVFSGGQFDYCYSRFSLHAVNDKQENELIQNVYKTLKLEGLFFVEVRSINDEIYGKGEQVSANAFVYEGHYRRFLRLDVLKKKLEDAGFEIVFAEEKRGFAPYKDSNPPIIRIIARKINFD